MLARLRPPAGCGGYFLQPTSGHGLLELLPILLQAMLAGLAALLTAVPGHGKVSGGGRGGLRFWPRVSPPVANESPHPGSELS